jgi:hypothetical protein
MRAFTSLTLRAVPVVPLGVSRASDPALEAYKGVDVAVPSGGDRLALLRTENFAVRSFEVSNDG